jgi:hypothetical protein
VEKKTVFIEMPEAYSTYATQESYDRMYAKLKERCPNIECVILPPGAHAVSADGPRYGVREELSGYSYEVWGDTKEEVMAMRQEVMRSTRVEVVCPEVEMDLAKKAQIKDFEKRIMERYAKEHAPMVLHQNTLVPPEVLDKAMDQLAKDDASLKMEHQSKDELLSSVKAECLSILEGKRPQIDGGQLVPVKTMKVTCNTTGKFTPDATVTGNRHDFSDPTGTFADDAPWFTHMATIKELDNKIISFKCRKQTQAASFAGHVMTRLEIVVHPKEGLAHEVPAYKPLTLHTIHGDFAVKAHYNAGWLKMISETDSYPPALLTPPRDLSTPQAEFKPIPPSGMTEVGSYAELFAKLATLKQYPSEVKFDGVSPLAAAAKWVDEPHGPVPPRVLQGKWVPEDREAKELKNHILAAHQIYSHDSGLSAIRERLALSLRDEAAVILNRELRLRGLRTDGQLVDPASLADTGDGIAYRWKESK